MCNPWTAEQMNSITHGSRDGRTMVACLMMSYVDNHPERMAAWEYENKLSGDVLDLEDSDDAVESELESLTAKRDCIELHFAELGIVPPHDRLWSDTPFDADKHFGAEMR